MAGKLCVLSSIENLVNSLQHIARNLCLWHQVNAIQHVNNKLIVLYGLVLEMMLM